VLLQEHVGLLDEHPSASEVRRGVNSGDEWEEMKRVVRDVR
jgi:hypothetical protein